VERGELALLQGLLEDLAVEVRAAAGNLEEQVSSVGEPDALFVTHVEHFH